ncbi:MAG: preprotein translocase subunit SecG [Planctomycetota bacterium]|nr:preprotein translocase subunit SecG [Planctomycetota bacterium]
MLVTIMMILLGMVTLLLGFVILIQEPKQAGLSGAFGLGGTDQMMGTKSSSGIGRFTAYLSVVFLLLCISVGVMARGEKDSSRLKDAPPEPGFGAVDIGTDGTGVGLGDALGDESPIIINTVPSVGDGDADAVVPDETDGETAGDAPTTDTPATDPPVVEPTPDDTPVVTPTDAPAETPVEEPAVAPAETGSGGGSGN